MKPRRFTLPSGEIVAVVLDNGQNKIIRERHFRGRTVQKAGNFALWDFPAQFIDELWFQEKVVHEILRQRPPHGGSNAVEFDFDFFVGWTSMGDQLADPAYRLQYTVSDADGQERIVEVEDHDLRPEEFELRPLRKGLKGEFVVDGSRAPLTKTVTVIAQVKECDWGKFIVIYSIRPGIMMPAHIAPPSRGWYKLDMWEDGLIFWDWESDGDDPADPTYPYGLHNDEPRINLLTGEPIVEEDEEDYDHDSV